jgi:hypothetical protein
MPKVAIASVYDRHGYADENKKIMEAVAAKIMSLVEGARTTSSRSRRPNNFEWGWLLPSSAVKTWPDSDDKAITVGGP